MNKFHKTSLVVVLLVLGHLHLTTLKGLGIEQLEPEIWALLARHLILVCE